MFAPADLLDRVGAIARSRLLREFGCSNARLAAAVRAGEIRRVRKGVYAHPRADTNVLVAAAHGGSLTCADALRAHGVWVLPDRDASVHVWMGGSGRRHPHPECSCIPHYSPGLGGVGLAPVADALVHAYRCLSDEAFFAAYESAWNRRLLSAEDRRRIRRELPISARWMLDLARPDAESGLESLLRLRLRILGLILDCQVRIDGVGRVDFVIDGRLILEADGKANHADAERRHVDLRRDAAASAHGYETLRFDDAMIIHDWPAVASAVLAALTRARA